MRTGVIVVFVLVAATPAYASQSCMTMAEARQHFATSHLYWHGANHCWDAAPPRHRLVRVKPKEDRRARQADREASPQEPRWRNAMSEMLLVDAPLEAASTLASIAPNEPPGAGWLDRWVDVVQVGSPAVVSRTDGPADSSPAAARKADAPTITSVRLILLLVVVTLAVIALLFRNVSHGWRDN
jgi:hypothetical protein